MNTSGAIVTFGEVMGRLAPPGFLRFRQAVPGPLDLTFAGAEANVAVSLAQLGAVARFVSAVPENPLADACLETLNRYHVDTTFVRRTDAGRLGLYFLETGANQRPSQVIYDRAGSAISVTPASEYRWNEIFRDAAWFHVTGITPAISQAAAEATRASVEAAKSAGVAVSCDLNFRKKLWRWNNALAPAELAQQTMRGILPLVEVVIANEEDAAKVLDIRAGQSDVEAGKLDIDRYPDVAREIVKQFGNVSKVAITLRQSISASHNNWGGMLYDAAADESFFAPLVDGEYQPYEIRQIVDRVGGGDAFAAGLIFAFNSDELAAPETALRFAVAASCLAHSIPGDFNFVSRSEVAALMGGAAAGRVVR